MAPNGDITIITETSESRIRPDKKFAPWKTEAEQTAVNLTRFVLGVIDQLAQKLGRY